jgi:hypothetical protein
MTMKRTFLAWLCGVSIASSTTLSTAAEISSPWTYQPSASPISGAGLIPPWTINVPELDTWERIGIDFDIQLPQRCQKGIKTPVVLAYPIPAPGHCHEHEAACCGDEAESTDAISLVMDALFRPNFDRFVETTMFAEPSAEESEDTGILPIDQIAAPMIKDSKKQSLSDTQDPELLAQASSPLLPDGNDAPEFNPPAPLTESGSASPVSAAMHNRDLEGDDCPGSRDFPITAASHHEEAAKFDQVVQQLEQQIMANPPQFCFGSTTPATMPVAPATIPAAFPYPNPYEQHPNSVLPMLSWTAPSPAASNSAEQQPAMLKILPYPQQLFQNARSNTAPAVATYGQPIAAPAHAPQPADWPILHTASQQMDQMANMFEERQLYDQADNMRQLAAQYRQQARHLRSAHQPAYLPAPALAPVAPTVAPVQYLAP